MTVNGTAGCFQLSCVTEILADRHNKPSFQMEDGLFFFGISIYFVYSGFIAEDTTTDMCITLWRE